MSILLDAVYTIGKAINRCSYAMIGDFNMAQAVMVRGSNPVYVKEEDRNKLVENMVRIVLLDPKAINAPVAVKKGVFEGQTSVCYAWKDGKPLTNSLLSAFADNTGVYMVTKYVKQGVVHLCLEWS